MKLSLKIAKVLIRLINEESIPASSAKSNLIDELVFENIILCKGKHRKSLELLKEDDLHIYLAHQLQISDLNNYISALENVVSSRADFVKITTDSKHSKERAFKGFLVNSYQSIEAELNYEKLTINPCAGSFVFIYDFETFKIPLNVIVVGVENAKNFSQIREQKYLFEDMKPLFISRYPQNQNKDFIKWMKSIPNSYLHFGDFDMAETGIYLNEYKKHLSQKATFFIPANIQAIIRKNGNRARFDKQRIKLKTEYIQEKGLLELIKIIYIEKKGLDQEFFINLEAKA